LPHELILESKGNKINLVVDDYADHDYAPPMFMPLSGKLDVLGST